jgi:apolipoprotein N-acyltransferase
MPALKLIQKFLAKIHLDPLTLLSSALVVLAFPPHDFSFLIWVALIPWLLALRKSAKLSHSVAQGLWFSVLMSLGGFYWVAYSIKNYGNLPWPIALPMYALFCFICQPQFPLFAALFFKVKHKFPRISFRALFCVPLIYCGIDSLIPKIFTDHLGHSLYKSNWIVQAADLGGVTLLTFIILLVNEGFTQLVASRGALLRGRFKTAVAALSIFVMFLLYGFFRYDQITNIQNNPTQTTIIGVIQANVGDFEKIAAKNGFYEGGIKIMQAYMSLSDLSVENTPKPEVLVWPETAYPSSFGQPRNEREKARDQMVIDYVKSKDVPLLFGGYDTNVRLMKDYNSTFFLTPDSMQVYHKSILLMFGETIPFYDDLPFLRKAFPTVGNFGRGPGPTVYEVKHAGKSIKFQPVICYEILFPKFLIDGANQGAEFILNVTNDSWFGPWGEPYLHLALANFRNIETRIPQVRSTNTGISALMLPNGVIHDPTDVYTIAYRNMSVPITAPIWTLIKAWGDWFSWVCIIGAMLAGFWLFRLSPKL